MYSEPVSVAWGILVTMLPLKINMYYVFWVCVCSLRYPACNVHAPNCYLWPVGSKFLNIKCFFFISCKFLFEIFLIVRRLDGNVITNVHTCSCKVLVILVTFLWNLNSLDMFSQNIEILNFVTIRLVEVELFHANERRTDGRTNRQTWQR